jgi:hypothetical protein
VITATARPTRPAVPAVLLVSALAVLALALQTAGAGRAVAGAAIVQTAGVSGSPPTLTLTASPATVARGAGATLSGRLTDPSTGGGVPGTTVAVEALGPDGDWTVAGEVTTDAAGWLSRPEVLDATTTFRLRVGQPGAAEGSVSQPVTVSVAALTATLSSAATRVGRPVTVSGVLAAGAGRALRLERRVGDGWQVLSRTTSGDGGAYSVATTPSTAGFWGLRVARGPSAAPTVSATLPRLDVFRLHTYAVRTRGGVRADVEVFRASVAETYADPRGWLGAHHRFRPAAPGRDGDFTVVLSQARYLPTFSSECSTSYSCRSGRNVVINETRWRFGSPYFPGTLDEYRHMVVNHETGHWLGFGHAYCSAPGRLAPVMQQQSKGMHGCRVNPWPLPREIRAAS